MTEMQSMPERITNPLDVWPDYFRDATTEDTQPVVADIAETLTLKEPILPEVRKHHWPIVRLAHMPHITIPHPEKHTMHIIRRGAIACAAAISVGFGAAFMHNQVLHKEPGQTAELQKDPTIEAAEIPEEPPVKPKESTPRASSVPVTQGKVDTPYSLPEATSTPSAVPLFSSKPSTLKTPEITETPLPSTSTSEATTPEQTPTPSDSASTQPSDEPEQTPIPTQSESLPIVTPTPASPSAIVAELPKMPEVSQSPVLGD